MKFTRLQIHKIRTLYEQGKTQIQIAQMFRCTQRAIAYWLMDNDKRKEFVKKQVEYFKNLPFEQRQEVYKRRVPYLRKYMRTRYHNDKDFHDRMLERQKQLREKRCLMK